MATATARRQAETGNTYRKHLQEELAQLPELLSEMQRANEALQAAENLVEAGERPARYVERFQAEMTRLQTKITRLRSQVPALLLNSCQDEELKHKWQETRVLRQRAGASLQAEQQAVQDVEERIASLRGRISARRGEPVFLTGKQKPEWSSGRYGWALRDTGTILFPHDDPNKNEHIAAWAVLQRELRLAQAARREAQERYAASMKNYEQARQALISSPI